jgi:hypothetical protein
MTRRLMSLNLPAALARYDATNEAHTRRSIERWSGSVAAILEALAVGPPVLTDTTRGSPVKGRVIYNSDDGQLNVGDGTNWTLPDGTTT